MPINTIDGLLERARLRHSNGQSNILIESKYFVIKQARACIFVVLFFAAVFLLPREGLGIIPRYDALLLIALAIQAFMLFSGIETADEMKSIFLFHFIGFCLEAFKTSSHIQSWSYPDFAYTKVFGVPLFSGFMYAAVGSYIIQAWRLFDVKIRHHPPYWMATTIALMIYANFFTHHYIGDFRWYIAACAIGLYARSTVIFTVLDRERRIPLIFTFILMGLSIWLAENLSTFYGIWKYPNQIGAWSTVHLGKWSSWSLLIIMTFTIVANLKHIKASIHIPE